MTLPRNEEYGGYFELVCGNNELYHTGGIYINSSRNALRYIIRAYGIQRLALPSYTCPVVWKAVKQENCKISFYDVTRELEPDLVNIDVDAFIVCNNYFGVRTALIQNIASQYSNIIVDNAQAFYAEPCGIASFYSPRKFFGLPDGGIAICDKSYEEVFETDILSHERCSHLLKRHNQSANNAYADFVAADKSLEALPIQYMSRLTRALMQNINHTEVKLRRRKNYQILQDSLASKNLLHIDLAANDVPLVYPLLLENTQLREALIENRIYTPHYWLGVDAVAPPTSNAYFLQKNIITLPVDQRYTSCDMLEILNILNRLIKI